jgi:hypothetical protein
MLKWSGKVKNLDLLKGGISLGEIGWCNGKNKSRISSTVLNSIS